MVLYENKREFMANCQSDPIWFLLMRGNVQKSVLHVQSRCFAS